MPIDFLLANRKGTLQQRFKRDSPYHKEHCVATDSICDNDKYRIKPSKKESYGTDLLKILSQCHRSVAYCHSSKLSSFYRSNRYKFYYNNGVQVKLHIAISV